MGVKFMQHKMIDELTKVFIEIAKSTWDRQEPYGPWPVYYGPKQEWHYRRDYEGSARNEASILDSQPFSTGGVYGY